MYTRIRIGILIFILALPGCKEAVKEVGSSNIGQLGALIEVEDLTAHLGDKDLRIIDMRKPEYYGEGHIEGAVNIWRDQLEDRNYPYGGMMAPKKAVEEVLGGLGIGNGHHLVIYDDRGCPDAARLWWMLRYYNFNNVSLLNGGLDAWRESGNKLSREPARYRATTIVLPDSTNTGIWAGKERIISFLNDKQSEMILIDTRTAGEYQGRMHKAGAAKAGRISQSIHIDWARAVDYQDHKKIRTADQLRELYKEYGITAQDTIVAYCHSGSRSALTTFVLTELLGFNNVRNYDGSWTEWSHFKQLPFERDSVLK